jgi:hypothetical protein
LLRLFTPCFERMSKLKNLGVNLGLTLGGLFMGVVIGEIGLRAAKIEGYPKIGDFVDSAPTQFPHCRSEFGLEAETGCVGGVEWGRCESCAGE